MRTYNTHGVNTYFKPTCTLRQIIVSPKDKTESKNILAQFMVFFGQGQTNRGKCEEFYWWDGTLLDPFKLAFSSIKTPILPVLKSQITSTLSLQAIILTLMRSKYWTDAENLADLKEESRRQPPGAPGGALPIWRDGVCLVHVQSRGHSVHLYIPLNRGSFSTELK